MCGIFGIMGHDAGVRIRADARKPRYTTLQPQQEMSRV